MTTMVNAAVTAMCAALAQSPAVCGEIARGRRRAVALELDQAQVVRPVQSEATQWDMNGLPIAWATSVAVECYARSGAATPPDVAVDVLIEATYERLLADPTLGGVLVAIRPQGIGYDFDADGQQTACATLVFNIAHRTSGATLN